MTQLITFVANDGIVLCTDSTALTFDMNQPSACLNTNIQANYLETANVYFHTRQVAGRNLV